jgi:hypothetical protein
MAQALLAIPADINGLWRGSGPCDVTGRPGAGATLPPARAQGRNGGGDPAPIMNASGHKLSTS